MRNAQDAMLAALTRREGRPTREQIVQAIGQQDAASASQSKPWLPGIATNT